MNHKVERLEESLIPFICIALSSEYVEPVPGLNVGKFIYHYQTLQNQRNIIKSRDPGLELRYIIEKCEV